MLFLSLTPAKRSTIQSNWTARKARLDGCLCKQAVTLFDFGCEWNWFITRCRQRSRGDLGIPKATWGEKRPRPTHDPAFRKILAIAVIVFQLRVVTRTPKILSSWPR